MDYNTLHFNRSRPPAFDNAHRHASYLLANACTSHKFFGKFSPTSTLWTKLKIEKNCGSIFMFVKARISGTHGISQSVCVLLCLHVLYLEWQKTFFSIKESFQQKNFIHSIMRTTLEIWRDCFTFKVGRCTSKESIL
jgi:hypothetical protein